MSSLIGKHYLDLPEITGCNEDARGIKPPSAGNYLIYSGDCGVVQADWDGERWRLGGRHGNTIRTKEVYEARGPFPGTGRLTRAAADEKAREDMIRGGLVGMLQAASVPGTEEEIRATIDRLGVHLT